MPRKSNGEACAPPRTAHDCADRAAEIFALDAQIEEQAEVMKALKKAREDLVQSLLVGCAGLRQQDMFEDDPDLDTPSI